MCDVQYDLFSFNARGLGGKIKRNAIFNHLKRKSSRGIFLLQETHSCPDFESAWKKEWGGDIYFSHSTRDSCGTAILLSPGLDIACTEEPTNHEGRTQFLRINANNPDSDTLIVNVYAPTRNKVDEQIRFLDKLKDQLKTFDYVHLLMGGDWNTIFNPKLDKQGGNMINCTNEYTHDLVNFMETYDLVDIIRLTHPDKTIFTRVQRNPLVLSRIDHWLISEHICNMVTVCKVQPGLQSDHSIINLKINNSPQSRGKGFWKFNSSLLHDVTYVNNIKEIVREKTFDLALMEDKGLKWDSIKCEIRGATLAHSFTKNKKRREVEKKLNNSLISLQEKLTLSADTKTLDEYEKVKSELENIEQEKAKGVILRSKIKWSEAGEKNTKYFLNLEKRNSINKTISRLEVNPGVTVNNTKEILNECKTFYSDLYNEPCHNQIDDNNKFFSTEHNTLSNDDKNICEGILTIDECTKAIKAMKNGKSPGNDGFTAEFYKFFWIDIKYLVLDSLNYAYVKGELSIDQKRGIITLIPKKGKNRFILKNWRPISLLNTDYKLLTKCLSFRLQAVLPKIIDNDQTGFLKDRYIGENIRTISDLIEYTSLKNKPGYILLIDFEKAFDTIRWSYLYKCLNFFNFGEMFIHWVKVIYSNIESTVINNGHTSQYFKLSRGIRQGCPVSPYLFIIAVEVMAIYIRQSKDIKGIWVGNTEFKISQLADDTGMFVLDIQSIKNVIKCLEDFKEISGLKLNVDKTIGKPIGSLTGIELDSLENIGIIWTNDSITTLGITITNDPVVNMEKNFKPRLKAMRDTLNIWLSRNLSLKGKITILKSLALPKLLYVSSNMPIPYEAIKEADCIISNFLWDHKKPKIKRNVMIQPIELGGLKAPDFSSMVKASRVAWVKRLLSPSKAKWKTFLKTFVSPTSLDDFIKTSLDHETIDHLNPFYKQIFKSWIEIKRHPECATEFLEEIIWNNRFIQAPVENIRQKKKTSLFFSDFYKAGITKIKDLISPNGDWMDLSLLSSKYDIKCNVLRYQRLKLAIPRDWFTEIKRYISIIENDNSFVLPNKEHNFMTYDEKNIVKSSTKVIYNSFVGNKYVTPTSVEKWNTTFVIDENDWASIYRIPYLCNRDTYLQSMQFRIIHRIFPCNKWFSVLKVSDTELCEFCGLSDTIEHYLYQCDKIGNFWSELQMWYNSISDVKVILTCKHVIFGLYYDNSAFHAINYIILLGKQYIRRQKYKDSPISIINFLVHLRIKLDIEREICKNNNSIDIFNKKWSQFIEYL